MGFVACDVFAFGNRTDKSFEDGHSAQVQIGAAVVDTGLGVGPEDHFGGMEIPDLERTVCGASHYAKDFLFGHRCFDYLLQRGNGLQGEMGVLNVRPTDVTVS